MRTYRMLRSVVTSVTGSTSCLVVEFRWGEGYEENNYRSNIAAALARFTWQRPCGCCLRPNHRSERSRTCNPPRQMQERFPVVFRANR